MNTLWFRNTTENFRKPVMFKLPNESIKTYCQVKLFDKNIKHIDFDIWVDDDIKLSIIKPHKWFLIDNIVTDENNKPLLEHITGLDHEYIKLKNGMKCYARNNLS